MCVFLLRPLVGFLGVKLEGVNSRVSYQFIFPFFSFFFFGKLLKNLYSSPSLPEILVIKESHPSHYLYLLGS